MKKILLLFIIAAATTSVMSQNWEKKYYNDAFGDVDYTKPFLHQMSDNISIEISKKDGDSYITIVPLTNNGTREMQRSLKEYLYDVSIKDDKGEVSKTAAITMVGRADIIIGFSKAEKLIELIQKNEILKIFIERRVLLEEMPVKYNLTIHNAGFSVLLKQITN